MSGVTASIVPADVVGWVSRDVYPLSVVGAAAAPVQTPQQRGVGFFNTDALAAKYKTLMQTNIDNNAVTAAVGGKVDSVGCVIVIASTDSCVVYESDSSGNQFHSVYLVTISADGQSFTSGSAQ
jgi:hypothetical protein